jgi:hypothetical protein
MDLLHALAVIVLGISIGHSGLYMVRTGKSPTGVPPGQEDFHKMHARAFFLLHRALGLLVLAVGLSIVVVVLSSSARNFH